MFILQAKAMQLPQLVTEKEKHQELRSYSRKFYWHYVRPVLERHLSEVKKRAEKRMRPKPRILFMKEQKKKAVKVVPVPF